MKKIVGLLREYSTIVPLSIEVFSMKKEEIANRVDAFAEKLRKILPEISDLKFEIEDGVSAIGGGAAPTARLETVLLALSHRNITAVKLEKALRNSAPPVIARIVDDRVLLDLRTVSESEEPELLNALSRFAGQNPA